MKDYAVPLHATFDDHGTQAMGAMLTAALTGKATLKAKGPGEVTASQIQATADIEIMNPDLVICHLDEGSELRMEFTVATGKGYVPADRNRPDDAPLGYIPIDSIFSPVEPGE